MNKANYDILLPKVKEFFSVNADLRSDLNRVSLREHHINLDTMIDKWCKNNSDIDDFKGLVEYLDDLNSEPHCITEMEEMYDFVYDFEDK